MKQFATLVVCFCLTVCCSAQDVAVETVVDGLLNPWGVAVQPGTGHVFVSDSGASRVIRIVDGKTEEVITGFPKDVYGTAPKFEIGPLGLAFVDQNTLIVGGGGNQAGSEVLRMYKVPEAGADAINAEQMEGEAQMLPPKPDEDIVGEGNFLGVVVIGDAVFATCQGDNAKGWVAKADLVDGKLANLARTIAATEKSGTRGVVAITKSPEGYIVIGQQGAASIAGDSLITFHDISDEPLADWKYTTGLNDISALAYGPRRGRLFATDASWDNPAAGGLFKIIRGDLPGKCKTEKIAALDKPTAMAFGEDGNLYITTIGTGAGGVAKQPGALVMIKGLDDEPKPK
jgi:hypothetical protein